MESTRTLTLTSKHLKSASASVAMNDSNSRQWSKQICSVRAISLVIYYLSLSLSSSVVCDMSHLKWDTLLCTFNNQSLLFCSLSFSKRASLWPAPIKHCCCPMALSSRRSSSLLCASGYLCTCSKCTKILATDLLTRVSLRILFSWWSSLLICPGLSFHRTGYRDDSPVDALAQLSTTNGSISLNSSVTTTYIEQNLSLPFPLVVPCLCRFPLANSSAQSVAKDVWESV